MAPTSFRDTYEAPGSSLSRTIVLILGLSASVACSTEAPDEEPGYANEKVEEQEESEASAEDEDSQSSFSLPTLVDSGNCDAEPPTPTLCEWLGSVDDVVYAEVKATRFVEEPLVTGSGDPVETCSGFINRAFEIDVEVLDSAFDRAPQQFTLSAGFHQMADLWSPGPYPDANGGIRWSDPNAGLVPGKRFGIAVHHDADLDRWSALDEHFFEVGSSGAAKFASNREYDCAEPPPMAGGLTLAEMATEAAACAPGLADDRTAQKELLWQWPEFAYAALCVE